MGNWIDGHYWSDADAYRLARILRSPAVDALARLVDEWTAAEQAGDLDRAGDLERQTADLIARLPAKPDRN